MRHQVLVDRLVDLGDGALQVGLEGLQQGLLEFAVAGNVAAGQLEGLENHFGSQRVVDVFQGAAADQYAQARADAQHFIVVDGIFHTFGQAVDGDAGLDHRIGHQRKFDAARKSPNGSGFFPASARCGPPCACRT